MLILNKQINTLKPIIVAFLFVVFLLTPVFVTQAQLTTCTGSLGTCILTNASLAGGFLGDPNVNFPIFVGNLIKFALTLLGTLFLILILYGGFMRMTAGGNTDKVSKSNSILKNSVIGLIIVIVSYAITITVFTVIISATGAA